MLGVGTDLVAVARIEKAACRFGERFLERVFLPGERRYCEARRDPYSCYAARFAAKEAVLKALGTGLTGGICWRDVEVVRENGAPGVRLRGRAAGLAAARGVEGVLLSLSHEGPFALAFVVLVGR
ncbi:holo-ACP synthase [Desulfovirgula thermocuniculi]|uniref:holo-ACP synthase n=1 Tax=Desulfovirgula thermocuniculi TaxID=348842 RepID=UPI000685DDFD|nr:holo-ACP synthase [Desulfovirgula thermocuniculi]